MVVHIKDSPLHNMAPYTNHHNNDHLQLGHDHLHTGPPVTGKCSKRVLQSCNGPFGLTELRREALANASASITHCLSRRVYFPYFRYILQISCSQRRIYINSYNLAYLNSYMICKPHGYRWSVTARSFRAPCVRAAKCPEEVPLSSASFAREAGEQKKYDGSAL